MIPRPWWVPYPRLERGAFGSCQMLSQLGMLCELKAGHTQPHQFTDSPDGGECGHPVGALCNHRCPSLLGGKRCGRVVGHPGAHVVNDGFRGADESGWPADAMVMTADGAMWDATYGKRYY